MLGDVLGDVLSPAIGIALSPIPIIAVILMMQSVRAARTAPAFAGGWLAGILVVALVVMLFVPASATGPGAGSASGWVKLALGVLFLVMAAGQWRSRPRSGQDGELPKWLTGIDAMSPGVALGAGAGLSALNPKNLPLSLAAGLSLAQVGGGGQVVGLIVFTLVAGASVLLPVIAYLLFRERMSDRLARMKDWLASNNATVMGIVLLILGVTLVGKGLGLLIS